MKKIISLFQRNYETDRQVRNEIVPGAEWVMAGEGVGTLKWDGTCCLIKDGVFYKRYDAKRGKTPPAGWMPAQPEPDPVTGHWPGWLKVGSGPEDRWHLEGLANTPCATDKWTYELVGPRVQGNPYGFPVHALFSHGTDVISVPRDYDGIRAFLEAHPIEGIVWWRDPADLDCDKVKIKAKDFGLKWPNPDALLIR